MAKALWTPGTLYYSPTSTGVNVRWVMLAF
jgi:hypothetical protein